MATAYAEGIDQGYSETLIGPDDLITREQMGVMIVRAFGLAQQSSPQTYADQAHISAWSNVECGFRIINNVAVMCFIAIIK